MFTDNHLAVFLQVPMDHLPIFLPQHDCDRSHNVRIKISESDGRAMITRSLGDIVQACKIKEMCLLSTTAWMSVFRYVFLLVSKSFVICWAG